MNNIRASLIALLAKKNNNKSAAYMGCQMDVEIEMR